MKWLFEPPKNYPEMLKKIAYTMFFAVIIGMVILTNYLQSFSEFIKSISFGMQIEAYNIKIYIADLYIPLFFAILENVFEFHDKVSDLFKIRYKFDKFVIIKNFLDQLNMPNKIKNVNKNNRKAIMDEIFYKYAGYDKPSIDIHLIYMALHSWSWYWIIIDTMIVAVITGILMLLINFSAIGLFTFVAILFVLFILSCSVKSQCKKYALREVNTILKLNNGLSQKRICRYLEDAL